MFNFVVVGLSPVLIPVNDVLILIIPGPFVPRKRSIVGDSIKKGTKLQCFRSSKALFFSIKTFCVQNRRIVHIQYSF